MTILLRHVSDWMYQIIYSTSVSAAEHESEFEPIKYTHTSHLALTGEPWGVYCEHFGKKIREIKWYFILNYSK